MAVVFKVDIVGGESVGDYANYIRQFSTSRKINIPKSIISKAIPGASVGKAFFNKKISMSKTEGNALLKSLGAPTDTQQKLILQQKNDNQNDPLVINDDKPDTAAILKAREGTDLLQDIKKSVPSLYKKIYDSVGLVQIVTENTKDNSIINIVIDELEIDKFFDVEVKLEGNRLSFKSEMKKSMIDKILKESENLTSAIVTDTIENFDKAVQELFYGRGSKRLDKNIGIFDPWSMKIATSYQSTVYEYDKGSNAKTNRKTESSIEKTQPKEQFVSVSIVNILLAKRILMNMRKGGGPARPPTMTNRTGRFANSITITRIAYNNKLPFVNYKYLLPYYLSNEKYGYDVDTLVKKSLREVMTSITSRKFNLVNVN